MLLLLLVGLPGAGRLVSWRTEMTNPSDGNPKPPQKYFRGTLMRPEILDLVESGELSCKEAVLLMIIDSLVEHGGQDCYASNEYLGKRIQTNERTVRRMISHLKKLGLLIQTGFTGKRRFLATAWSHSVVPRPDKTYKTGQNCPSSPDKTVLHNSPPTGDLKDNTIAPHGGGAKRGLETSKKKERHPRWIKYATTLKDSISKVRNLNGNLKLQSWAEAFRKIHEVDKIPNSKIRSLLKWYCSQVERGDLIQDNSGYLPIAYSGKAFREKFERIEAAMHRKANETREYRKGEDGFTDKDGVVHTAGCAYKVTIVDETQED